MSEYERESLAAARRQATGTVISAISATFALVISVAAVLVAAVTWMDQSGQNERTNSARIAMWATVGSDASSIRPAGLDVHLESRAIIPMHDARLTVRLQSGALAVAQIGDIPPCIAVTFRITPPEGAAFARTDGQWLGYTDLGLEFVEDGHGWQLTKDGLRRVDPLPDRSGMEALRELDYKPDSGRGCS